MNGKGMENLCYNTPCSESGLGWSPMNTHPISRSNHPDIAFVSCDEEARLGEVHQEVRT